MIFLLGVGNSSRSGIFTFRRCTIFSGARTPRCRRNIAAAGNGLCTDCYTLRPSSVTTGELSIDSRIRKATHLPCHCRNGTIFTEKKRSRRIKPQLIPWLGRTGLPCQIRSRISARIRAGEIVFNRRCRGGQFIHTPIDELRVIAIPSQRFCIDCIG